MRISRILSISLLFTFLNVVSGSVLADGGAKNADNVSHSLTASCGLQSATLSYRLEGNNRLGKKLVFSDIKISKIGESNIQFVEIGALPSVIDDLSHPFVQRILPFCIEKNILSFVVFVVSEKDINIPDIRSGGIIHTLHFDIDQSGQLKSYLAS